MHESSNIAGFLSRLAYDDLPGEVVETAKLCILDTIGVALAARRWPWTRMVAEQVQYDAGAPNSTVWGTALRVPAQQAALANATAAHGIEMDDRIPTAQEHPGSMAVPAAIAVAEQVGADGRSLITSVVAGYELGIRVGLSIRFSNGGLHWAGHKGVWPAVGAATKALGLDHQQMLDAFGLAGSMACGISEFSSDARGTMVKRLHGGLASFHGVLAALLGQRGLTGPRTVLEGIYGYCRVFASGGEPRFEELDRDLGQDFRITRRELKPYASWGGGHNAIDAVANIISEHPIDISRIAGIRVAGSRFLTERHGLRDPRSVMAAQYSLPFLTALALSKGPAALMDPYGLWTDAVLADPEVIGLVAKTEVAIDPDLEEKSIKWRHYGGARVTVTLDDGTEYEGLVHHSKGTQQNPMTPEEIKAKFRAVAGPVLPDGRVDRIVAYVDQLEDSSNISTLCSLLESKDDLPTLAGA